jgi:NADPH:quinone reductase-like Zn-dependent oxidoreductase
MTEGVEAGARTATTAQVAAGTMPAFVPSHDAAAGIELAQVPEPVPREDQALIAVEAYSVNRGEIYLLEAPRAGWRPGQDVAGRVLEPAGDGSGPSAGTRVVGHAWDGGWAPRVPVATESLAVLPEEVSAVTAATLPLAGLTAIRLLRAAGPLASRRVLITGASGGVGHNVVELAAAQGAQVTAVCSSAERGRRLRALGAAEVVESVEDTSGPFDIAMESVGGRSLAAALERMSPRGTVLWFGQASLRPSEIDFFAIPGRVAIRRFAYWPHDEPDRIDLTTLVGLVASGRLHPEIGLQADWRETPQALISLRDRRIRGNAVLTVTDTELPELAWG